MAMKDVNVTPIEADEMKGKKVVVINPHDEYVGHAGRVAGAADVDGKTHYIIEGIRDRLYTADNLAIVESYDNELTVKVNVDVEDALKALKALQREARKAARALREVEEAQQRVK